MTQDSFCPPSAHHERRSISGSSSSSNRNSIYDDADAEGVRQHWDKKMEYILAAVGYCVGLGNIWRFPYVCMRNGGGAFLIPFFLGLMICALPVYLLETAMGQFNGKSALHVWSMCPLFKGIGISMNILTFFFTWLYSIILAWSLIYLFHSFRSPLPWTLCGQWWNSPNCFVGIKHSANETINAVNVTLGSPNDINTTGNGILAGGKYLNVVIEYNTTTQNSVNWNNMTDVTKVSAAEEFWLNNVLQRSSGLETMGGLPWHLCLSLVLAYVLVLVGVIKGIRSTGKVVYVTATLPYLLLTVMLILGVTLKGSGDGILFYIKPDFRKLLEIQTWSDAFVQVFFSLGTGWGALATLGSYNKFNNNCMKDSIILTLVCEGTSVYGGFAIFAILGHMAHIAQVPIEEFARSGAGLAFIVYPTAISYLPLPQLWGVLFFVMLFVLGLDSHFSSVETLLTTAGDIWIKTFSRWRKSLTTLAVAFFTLTGLIFASQGGIYLFTLVDWYFASFSLLIQSAMECLIVAWIYGADNFCRDIELMIGRKPYKIFPFSWKYLAPVFLLTVFVLNVSTLRPPTYGSYKFSVTAQVFGWLLAISSFSMVIVFGVLELTRHQGSIWTRIKKSCKASPDWCPADPKAREKYTTVDSCSLSLSPPDYQECMIKPNMEKTIV